MRSSYLLPVAVLLLLLLVPGFVSGDTLCAVPSECLTEQQAVVAFGAGNFVQTSRDTCGYQLSATGARVPQYCFQKTIPARAAPPIGAVTTALTTEPTRPTPAAPVAPVAPAVTMTRATVATAATALPVYTTPPLTIAPVKPTSTATPVMAGTGPGKGTEFTAGSKPIVISLGSHTYAPLLGAGSPYQAVDLSTMPFIYLETDWIDNNARSYFSGEWKAIPNWTDSATLTIDKAETIHYGNFRYMTAEKNVKSVLWQVSRYPFPDDPVHWQNEYIPGLVASGEAKAYHTDDEGYRYFRINFARVARQNPGDPPYYAGTVPFQPGPLGQGAVLQTADIPFTKSGFTINMVDLGFFSIPVPGSFVSVPSDELSQAELGNPNKNMTLSCTDCAQLRAPAVLETDLLDTDRTFYVRVVPVHDGGKAGVPALPVEVTVRHPHPCPVVTSDIEVKLPSAAIVWYMKPVFGQYSDHWYYPWGDGFHPKGLHTFEPPPTGEDKEWWETLIDTFSDVVNFFSWVVTQYSMVWNMMQDFVVKYVGDALTIGWCSDHSECTSVLKTGLQIVMAAYGIPPTLPTGPELMDLSTDYMIKLGAEQLGAGELYDAYQYLPPEGKQALQDLKGKAQENAEKLTQASKDQRHEQSLKYKCFFDPQFTCTNRVPDPIFSVHPATVMVYMNNPAQNSQQTDRVLMTVSDSWHLYTPATRIVPALQPGEEVSIPVVLYEDYTRFRKDNGGPCDPHAASVSYTGSSSYENLSTCLMGAWMGDFQQPGEDTFTVTFSNGKSYGGSNAGLAGLDAQSNGKSLGSYIVADPGAGTCGVQKSVRFPQGWIVTTPAYSINPNSWDYLFLSGSSKTTNWGMLRNKP